MAGGQFDSSKTRVAPVFDQLKTRGGDWIRRLLALPQYGSGMPVPPTLELAFLRGHWGDNERGLWPPAALLSWLIRNLAPPTDSTEVNEDRARLIAGDADTVENALELLRSAGTGSGWHVFEGPTYPDAMLETPGALIVVEGKRTESGPTTHTTWMAVRHQMWRHMDAAWEIRGRRAVFGFFLVEGAQPNPTEVPAVWRTAASVTLETEVVDASFPHRGNHERRAIARGFLGVATWQHVCLRFGLDFDALPRTVSQLGA